MVFVLTDSPKDGVVFETPYLNPCGNDRVQSGTLLL
jgi:hypothetical protein